MKRSLITYCIVCATCPHASIWLYFQCALPNYEVAILIMSPLLATLPISAFTIVARKDAPKDKTQNQVAKSLKKVCKLYWCISCFGLMCFVFILVGEHMKHTKNKSYEWTTFNT